MRNRSNTSAHAEDANTGRLAVLGLILVITMLFGGAATLFGQESSLAPKGAVRPFVGAYIPTGEQRDLLKDAVLVGAQASWNATPNVALTGSFGWSPSKDKITAGDQTLDVYQYDVGVEGRSATTNLGAVSPFLGLGIGGRSYDYRDLTVESKSNFGGYGAVGFDASSGVLGLRVELRDYISGFKPLSGTGEAKTRNDLGLFVGLGVNF